MSVLEQYRDVLEKLPTKAQEVVRKKLEQGWTLWRVKVGETIELARGAAASPIAWEIRDFWVIAGSPTVEFLLTSQWGLLMGEWYFEYYSITFNNVGDVVACEVRGGVGSKFWRTQGLYVCVQD